MRLTTRATALAFAGMLLAGCGHRQQPAPLAFAPADTPYVVANLKPLDDDTRHAMLAMADAQLPAQLAQLRAAAARIEPQSPAAARLLRSLAAAFKDGRLESFAKAAGIDLEGRIALYGLGLSPVLRFDLADPKAFDGFVARLEHAYGQTARAASVAGQPYRKLVSVDNGTQLVLAVAGKQAVIALLPVDGPPSLLRKALGLQRPRQSLLDSDALQALAKAKGYLPWAVAELSLQRLLPLAAGGKDPLFAALLKASAERESAETGEPVSHLTAIPRGCPADAARIAARVPRLSLGYTRLDARHQDARIDVALAGDIAAAFDGLQANVPGLGAPGNAPFDLSLAAPMLELRRFWLAQADAVAARPFACPVLDDLNDAFAQLGQAMQKAAIPPFGDLRGLHLALDGFTADPHGAWPTLEGRLVLATANPAGLLGMAQLSVPALSQVRVPDDGRPVPLPASVRDLFGQPAWAAMDDKALALAVGDGEDHRLAGALAAPGGPAGTLMRMHLGGGMYLAWLESMAHGAGGPAADAGHPGGFAALETQAARVRDVRAEIRMDKDGLVISNQITLK